MQDFLDNSSQKPQEGERAAVRTFSPEGSASSDTDFDFGSTFYKQIAALAEGNKQPDVMLFAAEAWVDVKKRKEMVYKVLDSLQIPKLNKIVFRLYLEGKSREEIIAAVNQIKPVQGKTIIDLNFKQIIEYAAKAILHEMELSKRKKF